MRLALLLLLSACVTPDELQDSNRDVVSEMSPILEQAAAMKALELVAAKYAPQIAAMEKSIEDGDDAVRKEFEEGFHTLKDADRDIIATNNRQHAALNDRIVRNKSTDDERYAEWIRKMAETQGRVEGNDAALHQAEGVVRGLLFAQAGVVNQTAALAKDNERAIQLDADEEKAWRKSVHEELSEENRESRKKWYEQLEAGFWDLVEKVGVRGIAIAGVIASIVTGVLLWRRRHKETS